MQTQTSYLKFALGIRKLTDSLIRIVETGTKPPDFERSVRAVLETLGSDDNTSIKSLRDRGEFGRYDNIQTINEVFNAEDKKLLAADLVRVIRAENADQRTSSALDAIKRFDRLERRALYRFNHSSSPKRTATVL